MMGQFLKGAERRAVNFRAELAAKRVRDAIAQRRLLYAKKKRKLLDREKSALDAAYNADADLLVLTVDWLSGQDVSRRLRLLGHGAISAGRARCCTLIRRLIRGNLLKLTVDSDSPLFDDSLEGSQRQCVVQWLKDSNPHIYDVFGYEPGRVSQPRLISKVLQRLIEANVIHAKFSSQIDVQNFPKESAPGAADTCEAEDVSIGEAYDHALIHQTMDWFFCRERSSGESIMAYGLRDRLIVERYLKVLKYLVKIRAIILVYDPVAIKLVSGERGPLILDWLMDRPINLRTGFGGKNKSLVIAHAAEWLREQLFEPGYVTFQKTSEFDRFALSES